jgi:sugar phosphate isomerase/epimerase
MNNKIGVATATYHFATTEEALGGISSSGYKYVELLSVPGFGEHIAPPPEEMDKQSAEKLSGECKNYRLELFCIGVYMRLMREGSLEKFKRVIDAANFLDVKYINTDTGEIKNAEDEKRFYREMKMLGEYAALKNVIICLELHGDWCNTGKRASEIVKKINNAHVGVNYDTGNAIFYGGTKPEEDILYALPYITFVHLKDSCGKYKVYDFPVLGEGTVDFNSIFKTIEKYSGPMSVELEFDGKKRPLKEVNAGVKKCHDFLKSYGFM